MLIAIDHHSGVPVYRQLMDQIKFHIASGILQPGDELPSTRTLSARLGLNPMTVSKSYSFLEKENIVERRRGLPLIVKAFDPGQMQTQRLDQLRQSLRAAINVARQCEIENAKAMEVFSEMLDSPGNRDGRSK